MRSGWLQSPGAERATSFRVAAAVEELELTIFSVFLVVYFGLTFGLFAAAAAQSGQVRRWPASIATVTGVAAIGIGLYQLYFGLSNVTVVLFVTVWSIQPLWLIMVSIELWRAARSGRTERPSDAPG